MKDFPFKYISSISAVDGTSFELLGGGEKILTTQSLLFGFSIQKNNGLEGEIVAEKKENREERAVRRGSRPCSHEP